MAANKPRPLLQNFLVKFTNFFSKSNPKINQAIEEHPLWIWRKKYSSGFLRRLQKIDEITELIWRLLMNTSNKFRQFIVVLN